MKKIKLGDEVIVRAGKDRGKSGKVQKINLKKGKVLVEGVNLMKKTVKPTQENPDGGISEVEAYLDMSNVGIVSPKTGKASRVGIRINNGTKERFLKGCGTTL